VVNYRTENTAQRLMEITGGVGVDHIVEVDFAGNFPVTQEVLKLSGVVAVYAAGGAPQPPVPLQFRSSNITVRMVLVYDMPEPAKTAAVDDITRWLESGALSHLIGPRFPLDDVVQAHQAVEGGAIGNVIVDVAPV
jgi:NADPH:quinone reductase-like Zn-dependent oxidoreductase